MLALEENFFLIKSYVFRDDIIIKILSYSATVLVFIQILRNQVPEVDLLQLIPGFYLALLVTGFFLLIILSASFLRFPNLLEMKKGFGMKTSGRIKFTNISRIAFVFLFSVISINLNTLIPSSLDSFNSYGEQTLENIWSFNEVLNVETILIFSLVIVSQFPVLASFSLQGEQEIEKLPKAWRFITFSSVIFAGIATPTIDGNTQLSFLLVILLIYLLVILILAKQIGIKFKGLVKFGS